VDTGVCATCAVHADRLVGNSSQAALKLLLYRVYIQVGLHLPAIIVTAIVLDAASDPTPRGKRGSRKRE